MALRNNVYDLKLELWHILKPLEYYLMDIIIDKTIKWREKSARITIQEFMERTRQADTHIYAALRTLKKKNIIIYERQKYYSCYGLNEEFFGGLLIKRHEDALQARRNKIKLAVDNSKPRVETTDENGQIDRRISSVPVTNSVSSLDESRQSKQGQDFETIGENRSLKTLLKDISLNTSLQSGEREPQTAGKLDFSLLGKHKKNPRQCENLEEEKARQLREAKAAGIL